MTAQLYFLSDFIIWALENGRTDGQTDGRTDERTDGRTNNLLWQYDTLHCLHRTVQ